MVFAILAMNLNIYPFKYNRRWRYLNIQLAGGTIVILSSAHNPAVLTPEWLMDKLSIKEKPKQHVSTPAFAVFDSESISIIGDVERMQFGSKKLDKDSLVTFMNIVISYIEKFEHIPYKSLGLNFLWNVESAEGEELPNINVKFNDENKIPELLNDHEVSFGTILRAKKDPYVLRAMIDRKGKNILNFDFNYHHDTNKMESKQIIEIIQKYIEYLENSQKIVESILP